MASDNPPFARAWLAQWDSAATNLAKLREKDLHELSDVRALIAIDALLDLGGSQPLDRWRLLTSGLVEQQRMFAKLR